MRALVLSGGGVKGAYQVGALKHLIGDLGRNYDILSGISVGALNCSFMSMFSKEQEKQGLDKLLGFWHNANNKMVYKRWFPFGKLHALWKNSLYNSQPLVDLVRKNVNLEKVRQSGRIVSVGAVSLTTGHYKVFTGSDDHFVDGVIASSAFPAGLKAIEIAGELYTDGGVKHVTPLGEAIKYGATEIDMILCSPMSSTDKYDKKSAAIKLALRTIDLMTDELVAADLKKAVLHNEIASLKVGYDKKYVKINIIQPVQDLTENSLDFDHDKIMEMMEKGYQDSKIQF